MYLEKVKEKMSEREKEKFAYYQSIGYDEKMSVFLSVYTYGSVLYGKDVDSFLKYYADGRPNPTAMIDDVRQFAQTGLRAIGTKGAGGTSSKLSGLRMSIFSASRTSGAPEEAAAYYCEPVECGAVAESYQMASSAMEDGMMMFASSAVEELETDNYESIEEKKFQEVMGAFMSTFRMTTNTASAGIVLNQLRSGRRISQDMVRIEEMLNYFRYKAEKPKEETFKISHEMMDIKNGNKLLYINVQGKDYIPEKQNIILLLDVSGSMSSEAETTQLAMATVVSRLKAGDKFSCITYSSSDETVFDSYEVKGDEDKNTIMLGLVKLRIGGCTYGSAGIETAYKIGKKNYVEGGNNQVILITDGDLNFGIADKGGLIELIEEKKKDNLFLSVLGTGLMNYKDDKLEALAKHGNGVYKVINNLNDVRKSILEEYASLTNVIAKDVKAQVEFNPKTVKSFRLLGFENRELKDNEFRDDTVISEPFGSGGYGVALYELEMNKNAEAAPQPYKYATVQAVDSDDVCTVRVRFKQPLNDVSEEIEYIVKSSDSNASDNAKLAYIVYVCSEKLRGSNMITTEQEEEAKELCGQLGEEILEMNGKEFQKLAEMLKESKGQLNVGIHANDKFDW